MKLKHALTCGLATAAMVSVLACSGGNRSVSATMFEPPDVEEPGPTTVEDPGAGSEPGGNSDLVAVCHKPEDGSAATHTILVADPAVEHHLGHGDALGECPASPLPAAEPDRTTLCHVPSGNPAKAHTIVVGDPAVDHHLGHGDTLGACTGE